MHIKGACIFFFKCEELDYCRVTILIVLKLKLFHLKKNQLNIEHETI